MGGDGPGAPGSPASPPAVVGVVGSGDAAAPPEVLRAAALVGERLASRGAVLVCGGLGGVMEAACQGARAAGGMTVGLLPGSDRREANRFVRVAVPTGMGELRNGLVVRSADALVAIGGGFGTLSEVALALKAGKRVVGLHFPFALDAVVGAGDAEEAVRLVLGA